MSLIEFIGFIISFIAMIVLFFKRTIDRRRQDQNPELYEKMEQQKEVRLREMLRTLDVYHEKRYDDDEDDLEEDDEEDEYVTPVSIRQEQPIKANPPPAYNKPVRTVKDGYEYRSKIELYKPQTSIEKRYAQTNIGDSYHNRFAESHIVSPDMEERGVDNPYALGREPTKNRLTKILGGLESKQDMIILQEIVGPPKGLR